MLFCRRVSSESDGGTKKNEKPTKRMLENLLHQTPTKTWRIQAEQVCNENNERKRMEVYKRRSQRVKFHLLVLEMQAENKPDCFAFFWVMWHNESLKIHQGNNIRHMDI